MNELTPYFKVVLSIAFLALGITVNYAFIIPCFIFAYNATLDYLDGDKNG